MASYEKLFEVSWEVCNFVGGINTVLKTKAKQAIEHFNDNYLMIGPWLEINDEFIETPELFSENIKKNLKSKGFKCKFGYWNIEGNPKVILVAYQDRNSNDILYKLWKNFGVESYAAQLDYIEPVLFSSVAAEVIETIVQHDKTETIAIFAHFHEWLTAAGLLYLKKIRPDISTIFTIHATVMGRTISSYGNSIFDMPTHFDYHAEAKKHAILPKHSIEQAAAREADCFTAVSYTTAEEANIVLKEHPDKITFNGLNFDRIASPDIDNEKIVETRTKILQVAKKMLGKSLPDNTRIWITSGRNEFHNKGYDVLLSSLAELESGMNETSLPIVVFFCIALKRCDKTDSLLDYNYSESLQYDKKAHLLTHRIENEEGDLLLQYAKHLKFDDPNRKVHIIYCPAYLNGNDGVFDIPYYTFLSACDLTIFPSFYEPWGYTPLESIAYGVPTITTDLAGFGSWIRGLSVDYADAVYVLERRGVYDTEFIGKLTNCLAEQLTKEISVTTKIQAQALAKFADWKFFYRNYMDSYEQAIEATKIRINDTYLSKFGEGISEDIIRISNRTPKLRAISAEFAIPEEIKELVNYSYNLWWTWQLNAYQLFSYLNPSLWIEVNFNPIKLINRIPRVELKEKMQNEEFSTMLNNALENLKTYSKAKPNPLFDPEFINDKHPVAYFCMEYGLYESLPLYAGGLGILAGDHLKTASDMQLPLIAFGLLYKHGYFKQIINSEGNQIAKPNYIDSYTEPLILLKNKSGKEILIEVELPGRICYLRVWEVNVGRIKLHLLDSDTPMNFDEDRKITSQLYPHEVETRLIQGIVLGIGGTRLIDEVLKIHPSVFHMNECHTAFLLLERMKILVDLGFTVRESVEIIRKTTIYTIHTPVLAAQEIFTDEMIKKYFLTEAGNIGIDIADMLALGRTVTKEPSNFFSLTASAIRSSFSVNAVSKLHQKVSQKLWRDIWPDALELEIPINSVTNGIHLQTWLGPHMWTLYNKYMPDNWAMNLRDKQVWENIYKISESEIWEAHKLQKQELIDFVKEKILSDYLLRGETRELMEKTLSHLNTNTFIMVFSRRFTEYKRPTFIFKNPERLAEILTNPEEPAVLLISGKAHPFDGIGREFIHEIIQWTRSKLFDGRIIFLDDYDMLISRFLVRGADLWLNNPIQYMEASGTSGMKAALNGAINYSVRGGWWHEAYTAKIGWSIDTHSEILDPEKRDDIENYMMLNKLQNTIIPTYFTNTNEGYPTEWIKMMKASIATVGYQFNSQRMLNDYYELLYLPAAKRFKKLVDEKSKSVSEYIDWKNHINKNFKSLTIHKVHASEATKESTHGHGKILDISIELDPGKLNSEDLRVDLLLMKSGQSEEDAKSFVAPLPLMETTKHSTDTAKGVMLTYALRYKIEENGLYAYAIRITPKHPLLRNGTELELVVWV